MLGMASNAHPLQSKVSSGENERSPEEYHNDCACPAVTKATPAQTLEERRSLDLLRAENVGEIEGERDLVKRSVGLRSRWGARILK